MRADNDNKPLRFLSVCSGIEAASVAWPQWRAVAFSEIEKFPSAVLAHHYPDVPNLGDFTKIDTTKLGRVDILCGGTPCQAFSVAGLRRSLDDARGNLSLAFVELAHELAGAGRTSGNGLRNVIWENVVGVLSTKDNAFGCFLAGLVGADAAIVPSEKPADGKSSRHWKWRKGGRYPVLDDDGEETGEFVTVEPWHALTWPSFGMVSGPKGRAAWAIKDAQYFGVAQRRRRVIVVADFGNGADPAAVLFEPEDVPRHSPPSRETGEKPAPTISARTKGGGGLGTDFDLDGGLVEAVAYGGNRTSGPIDVATAVNAHGGPHGRLDFESETFVTHPPLAKANSSHDATKETYVPEIARCVATREGSSQDYESTTMVAQQVYSIMPQNSGKDYKARPVEVSQPVMAAGQSHGNQGGDVVCVTGNVTHTLKAEGADASEDGTVRGTPIIAFTAKDYGGDAAYDVAPTLRAGTHSGSHANAGVMPAVTVALRGREGGATAELGGEVATALRASSGGGDKPHVLAFGWQNSEHQGDSVDEHITPTLDKSKTPAVLQSAVRRLTPVECERLQGFLDNYTAIPWRGKPASECPDGPRYKALGNSWAVPLFTWLGRRIDKHMPAGNRAANDNQEPARAAA